MFDKVINLQKLCPGGGGLLFMDHPVFLPSYSYTCDRKLS